MKLTIHEYDPYQDQPHNKNYHISQIEQLPQQRFIYLLIDGAAIKALPLIYTQNQQPEFEVLYHSTKFQEMLDISPVIVRFDNNIELQKLYNEWQNHAIAFTSTADLRTTANHLRSLILCRMPNTQPAFFRFYAANWLYPLLINMDEADLYDFTGPIDNWFIPDNDKQWCQIKIAKQGQAKEKDQECWFILNEALQEKLADYNYQKYIDDLTMNFTFFPLQSVEGQKVREEVAKRVAKARIYDLDLKVHIYRYVELSFKYPEHIDQHQALVIICREYEMPRIKLDQLEHYLKQIAQEKPLLNNHSTDS